MRRDLGQVLGWRILAAAVSFFASIAASRLIIEEIGVEGYGAVSLVMGLVAMIPFADLGLGGAIVNASSDLDQGVDTNRSFQAISVALRILTVSALTISVVSALLLGLDLWPQILGDALRSADGTDLGASVALWLLALNLVASMSVRVLQGQRRNALTMAISTVGPLVSLMVVWLVTSSQLPTGLAGAASAAAMLAIGILCWVPVVRRDKLFITATLSAKPDWRSFRAALTLGLSGLAVSILTVVFMQSDRYLLSFWSSSAEVGRYALLVPLYLAAWGVITPLGLNLWPLYRQQIAEDRLRISRVLRDSAVFALIGLAAGICLFVFGPWVVSLMTGAASAPENEALFVALGVLLVVQAAIMPLAMTLTDQSGFASQIPVVAVSALVKVFAGYYLIIALGAVGGPIATLSAIIFIQAPSLLYLASKRVHNYGN